MGISIGSSNFVISEANYAANFKSTQHDAYNSTPQQVFEKYNTRDISQQDYSQMEQELWLNKNPESHYTGLMTAVDDVKQHFADEANGTQEAAKSNYNPMDAVERDYKKELSGNGAKSDYYLKLYQYWSEAKSQQIR